MVAMWYVYVLRGENKKYVGVTQNLRQRIQNHQAGNTHSTARMGKLQLILYEAFLSKSDAYRQEKFYKTGYGREVLDKKLEDTLNMYSGFV